MDHKCPHCCEIQPPASWASKHLFNPQDFGFKKNCSVSDMEVTGVCDCVTYLRCPRTDKTEHCCDDCNIDKPLKHSSTIVVSFDGVEEEMNGGQTAMGVFFGSGSPLNFNQDMTNIVAYQWGTRTIKVSGPHIIILKAAYLAIKYVRENWNKLEHHQGITRVIFRTDNTWFIKHFTETVPDWDAGGWKTGSGVRGLRTKLLWQELVAEVKAFEKMDIQVLFWSVSFEDNRDATMWAHLTFDLESLKAQAKKLKAKNKHQTEDENGEMQMEMITYYSREWCVGCLLDLC